MNVLDLDEAQGFTPERVREWLHGKGWLAVETRNCGEWWISPTGTRHPGIWLPHEHEDIQEYPLGPIAACYSMTIQELLREINPRMRPWPSDAAVQKHGGSWIVQDRDTGTLGIWQPHMMTGRRYDHLLAWPCDRNGNKVRYPTDATGNML